MKKLFFMPVLLSVFAWQCLQCAKDKAPTADELAHHVASGYSYLVTHDFRMNPASPPLPRMLAAVPLLVLKAKAPLDHGSWESGNTPVFSQQFFYVYNHSADLFIFLARLPIVFLGILFGFCLFLWVRSLFSADEALVALALFSFSPNIIAHSSLATADIAVALFMFLSWTAFYFYLENPCLKNIFLAGAAAGLAFLSKYSALALFPTFFLIALFSKKWACLRPSKVILFLAVCFLTIWAGYFFEIKTLLLNTPDPAKKAAMYQKIGGAFLLNFAQHVPVPLSTFVSSLVSMLFTRAKGTSAFLMGEWSRTGWWYYYYVAFLIKNTIPMILLSLAGLAVCPGLNINRTAKATLLVPIAFFFLATMNDKAQAGIRYFLPVYPLFFTLAGAACLTLIKKSRALAVTALLLIVWHAAEAAYISPNNLAYFNELVGGPRNGYKYLRDSNLDWGQDLKGLSRYVLGSGLPQVALFYPWPANPDMYNFPYRRVSESEFTAPKNCVYAISAHYLDLFIWAKGKKPAAQIGYSIFIYDLRKNL